MTRRMISGGLAALTLLCAHAGNCATPEQAGTYVGTMKGKKYVYATGVKSTWSSPVTMTIDAGNNVLIEGTSEISYVPGVGTFGVSDGFMRVSTANSGYVFTMHFKNGQIKGTASFGGTQPGSYMIESKMALRKQ